MGLKKTSFTAADTDSDVTRFSGTSTTVVTDSDDTRHVFVANFYAANAVYPYERLDSLYRSCRVKIQTDASGVKDLSFTLNGRSGNTAGTMDRSQLSGPLKWAITETTAWDSSATVYQIDLTMDTSVSPANPPTNVTASKSNINLLPNKTYYLWIWYSGKCFGYGSNGLSLTASGAYGDPAEITVGNGKFGYAISMSYVATTSGATYTVKTSTVVDSGGNNGPYKYEETLQTQSSTSSRNWTPAFATYAPKVTTKMSTTCTITVSTYFGGALVGSKSKTITIAFVESEVAPTIGSGTFSCAPLNQGAVSGMTGYIQGYSKIRTTFNNSRVTYQYGATPKQWKVKFGSAAEQTVQTSTTTKDSSSAITGSTKVVMTVVDSRGATASTTYTTSPYYSYVKPTLSLTEGTDYYRCAAGSDTPTDDGTRLALVPHATFSSLGGQNSITFAFWWKYTGSSQWVDKTTEANLSNGVKSFVTGLEDRSYDLWMSVTDIFGNSNRAVWERQIASSLHFLTSTTGWDGAAFGRVADYSDTLDIGDWDLRCGNVIIDGEDLGALLAQIKAALNIS